MYFEAIKKWLGNDIFAAGWLQQKMPSILTKIENYYNKDHVFNRRVVNNILFAIDWLTTKITNYFNKKYKLLQQQKAPTLSTNISNDYKKNHRRLQQTIYRSNIFKKR